jgi:thymidylate synthase (FAD)
MGKVIIQEETTLYPISLIGEEAGICWGADTSDRMKNQKRGMDCIKSNHGRTMEFPDVYMILDGYSARVIREFYTHIGGAPTRLQASTRYIDYEHGFDSVCPASIKNNKNNEAWEAYINALKSIKNSLQTLDACGIPREDSAMLLPLGMTTKVVVKINARTLMDMSRQRMCNRAYWEYRVLFKDICEALSLYSEEWEVFVAENFMAKCDACGYCVEAKCCGKKPTKKEFFRTYNIGLIIQQYLEGKRTLSEVSESFEETIKKIIEEELQKQNI